MDEVLLRNSLSTAFKMSWMYRDLNRFSIRYTFYAVGSCVECNAFGLQQVRDYIKSIGFEGVKVKFKRRGTVWKQVTSSIGQMVGPQEDVLGELVVTVPGRYGIRSNKAPATAELIARCEARVQ